MVAAAPFLFPAFPASKAPLADRVRRHPVPEKPLRMLYGILTTLSRRRLAEIRARDRRALFRPRNCCVQARIARAESKDFLLQHVSAVVVFWQHAFVGGATFPEGRSGGCRSDLA